MPESSRQLPMLQHPAPAAPEAFEPAPEPDEPQGEPARAPARQGAREPAGMHMPARKAMGKKSVRKPPR